MTTKNKKKKKQIKYGDSKRAAQGHGESDFTPSTFKVPDGMKLFRFKKEGTYKLAIIPYQVGKLNKAKGIEEGDAHWELSFSDHGGLGPSHKQRETCNRVMFDGKCAACDHRTRLARLDDDDMKEMLQSLREKKRTLMLVYDLKDPDSGIQLFESSFYKGFPELIVNKINADEDGELGYADFYKLGLDGMNLQVLVEEEKWNGNTVFKPVNVEFLPRKKEIPESFFDDAPCLDELIKKADQKKLKELLAGEEADEKDEDEDDDEDDDEDEDEAPKKKKKGKPAPSKKSKKDDDDEDEDDDEDDEDEDEDEEDEKPAKKKGGKSTKIPTAKEAGIKVGTKVEHEDYGECTVTHISSDGTALRIEDEDEEEHKGIGVADVEVMDDDDEDDDEDEAPKKKGKPAPKKSKKDDDDEEDDEDEDDDDEDEDDDDEDEKPKKKKSKPAPKSKKKSDDDDDEDEDDDDEDEDEKPKKKGKKKKSDDDDDDEDDDIPF